MSNITASISQDDGIISLNPAGDATATDADYPDEEEAFKDGIFTITATNAQATDTIFLTSTNGTTWPLQDRIVKMSI